MALTTINPGAVFGPAMDARHGTSLEPVERAMSGKDPVAPPVELPLVDVRDATMMHVAAIDLDAAKGQRFSATSETLCFVDMHRMLKDWDPSLKTATKEAPAWLLRVLAVFMADARLVAANVGRSLAVSGAKAEATFDFTFILAKDAIIASAESIRHHKA